MREIKFRAWDKKFKTMMDVGSIEFLNGGIKAEGTGVHIGNGWVTEKNGFKHDCDVVLMQHTGVLDKNGKEICEGDVCQSYNFNKSGVAIKERIGEIRFNNGMFQFGCYSIDLQWFVNEHDLEVVGNVYENPGLLDNSGE